MKTIQKNMFWLTPFFIAAIFFRLWFSQLIPQPFVFDQWEYHDMAKDMIAKKEYNTISPYHSYRLAGYPFILAVIYYIFGEENQLAWMSLQAILDALVAVFIFLIAKRIFNHQTPAWIAYIIYLFNPFTSAYVGVRLTEITATFLLSLTFLLLLLFLDTRKTSVVVLLGFILGFLPQVRPSFTYFSLLLIIFLIYKIIRNSWREKLVALMISILLFMSFIAPFYYNVWRNLTYYKRFSFLTVDNVLVKEFYISLFIEHEQWNTWSPPEVAMIHQEYSLAVNKQEMANKYWQLALAKIRLDSKKFWLTRLKKLWYAWEKHYIFEYNNPEIAGFSFVVYWTNVVLLALAALGYILWLKKEIIVFKQRHNWLAFLLGFLFVYISIVHTVTHAEERFSIPAYPFVFLFVSFSVWYILGFFVRRRCRHIT